MFNKENIDANSFTKISFIRSPLKEFPLNTFNFIFSSRKKDSNVKKLEFSIKKTVKKITPKKALNIDISDNDLINIFEALNKTIQKNNINQKNELKEYNENESLNNNILLNKKRKRKFKTIKAYNNQKKFIKYKISKNETKDSIKNNKISVLTYNILNPACLKKEPMKYNISTDERMKKIKKEILDLSPDIFCLQEADIYIYKKYLCQNDMNTYDIIYGVNCGSSFINIIGYKKNKFILKSFKNFSLFKLGKTAGNRGIMNANLELINNEDIDTNNKNTQNFDMDLNDKIENLPKNLKKIKKIISLYNVHFPWKYENDRIILLNMIYNHIKENSENNDIKNILIMGDFNSEPNSKLIKLFYYNKFLKSEYNKNNNINNNLIRENKSDINLNTLHLFEEIYNKYKFNSAYQFYSKEKIYNGEFMRHPAFTSRTKYFKKTIDYIFFSKNLKLRKILKLPKSYEVDKEKFLPSKEFPSDHLKLYAEFLI